MSNYHFIGIKGSGMSALAQILHDMNHTVQGSDVEKAFFTQQPLEKKNISILPFRADNIQEGQTVVASAAYGDTHEEVKKAKQSGLEVHSYPQFLGEFLQSFTSIAVAGSHGKTTTTGLLAHVLEAYKPTSYLIGDGTGKGMENSRFFTFEACEYRRHFLNYVPDYAIMTNIDFDHPDYFSDVDDVVQAFNEMAQKVKKGIVACGDDEHLQKLHAPVPIVYYGIEGKHDFNAENISVDENGTHFDVQIRGDRFGHFTIPGYGNHHILNALAVIAICHYEEVPAFIIREQLASFSGVKRRFTEKISGSQVLIDDYAHHPTEIRATIESAKQKYPNRPVAAVFQPHTFSRTKAFLDDFADSLQMADYVYLCDIFGSAREQDGSLSIDDLKQRIPGATIIREDGVQVLETHNDAVLLFMGAGDIQKFQSAYEAHLESSKQ